MIGIGIRSFFTQKPVGFWANVENFPVKDLKGYNYATGKLFIVCQLQRNIKRKSKMIILGITNTKTMNTTII